MYANVNLTVPELITLCNFLADSITACVEGRAHLDPEELDRRKQLFRKLHAAWGQQIIAPNLDEAIRELNGN